MARTTGRSLALLALLQARRDWSGVELCERLEVSPRTLRRDIDDLRELGYGIEATRGRHGGYRLGAGASVPPLTLTVDESVAIAVGLRAAAAGVITGIEESSARALAKLEQSLSTAARRQIVDVEQAMVPLRGAQDDIDMDVVTTAARAIAERRLLRVDYTRHDGTGSRRIIEPHRIVHTERRWYLIARDTERRAWRTLRLDRIQQPRIQPETFTRRVIPDDALRTFTTRSITTSPYRCRAKLRIHAPASAVSGAFGPTVAEVTAETEHTSILTAGANTPEEFASYLGASGFEFEVIEGDELRTTLTAMAQRFRRAAGT
ncbi:helix-turn-helix transcriptional regulator [Phytoactinopolyspora limicola]|uniref:helix-turn-helix transcriptional regulator n=1 Tax=Phytoactinopolyspora limicola TaxID=2715536 RepID=UPI00140AF795|nr:YafY family protein [Phytoactinopolyspora limicola]